MATAGCAARTAVIDRWSAARGAREAQPLATAIIRTARITWILFVLLAVLHIYFQYQFQRRILTDIIDLTLMASEARVGQRIEAARTEVIGALSELETRVDIVIQTMKVADPEIAPALPPTRAAKEEQRGGH